MNHPALVLLCACALTSIDATAQSKSAACTAPSAEQLNAIYPELESLYLDLHRTPELAMREQQTSAKLAERDKSLVYEVTAGVRGTDIVAVLRNGPGPKALLRTDMDALPIEEKTGLPFASHAVVKQLRWRMPAAPQN